MEFKTCHEFSIKKGDNVYTLHVPPTASIGELLDVAFQLLESVTQIATDKAQAAAPQEVRVDEAPTN